MKYVRFTNSEHKMAFGFVEGEQVHLINGSFLDSNSKPLGVSLPLDQVILLAPVEPRKVVCVGLNYALHINELKDSIMLKEAEQSAPEDPVIFMKPHSSVIGPDAEIIYPKISQRVDFEAELAVIIGKTTKDSSEEDATKAIFGYACANDVTARDLQKKDGQWTRGKSFDTFCPVGPWVVTDIDPSNLSIQLLLNGEIKQSSSTKHFIHSIPKLVSFISQVMTLFPGDVILTGTPEGVGPMLPGDEVIVRIESIGDLKNSIRR